MKTYYLRMRFQYREVIHSSNDGRSDVVSLQWTERTVKTEAHSILDAAHDAQHIINGYVLGTGLEADCDGVHLSNRGPYLEFPHDFAAAYPLNDNTQEPSP